MFLKFHTCNMVDVQGSLVQCSWEDRGLGKNLQWKQNMVGEMSCQTTKLISKDIQGTESTLERQQCKQDGKKRVLGKC